MASSDGMARERVAQKRREVKGENKGANGKGRLRTKEEIIKNWNSKTNPVSTRRSRGLNGERNSITCFDIFHSRCCSFMFSYQLGVVILIFEFCYSNP
jgi:hypothetical protein